MIDFYGSPGKLLINLVVFYFSVIHVVIFVGHHGRIKLKAVKYLPATQ